MEDAIVHQVEWYMGRPNLFHDEYLKARMDDHLWVSLDVILAFPKMARMRVTDKLTVANLLRARSSVVEVHSDNTRIRPAWARRSNLYLIDVSPNTRLEQLAAILNIPLNQNSPHHPHLPYHPHTHPHPHQLHPHHPYHQHHHHHHPHPHHPHHHHLFPPLQGLVSIQPVSETVWLLVFDSPTGAHAALPRVVDKVINGQKISAEVYVESIRPTTPQSQPTPMSVIPSTPGAQQHQPQQQRPQQQAQHQQQPRSQQPQSQQSAPSTPASLTMFPQSQQMPQTPKPPASSIPQPSSTARTNGVSSSRTDDNKVQTTTSNAASSTTTSPTFNNHNLNHSPAPVPPPSMPPQMISGPLLNPIGMPMPVMHPHPHQAPPEIHAQYATPYGAPPPPYGSHTYAPPPSMSIPRSFVPHHRAPVHHPSYILPYAQNPHFDHTQNVMQPTHPAHQQQHQQSQPQHLQHASPAHTPAAPHVSAPISHHGRSPQTPNLHHLPEAVISQTQHQQSDATTNGGGSGNGAYPTQTQLYANNGMTHAHQLEIGAHGKRDSSVGSNVTSGGMSADESVSASTSSRAPVSNETSVPDSTRATKSKESPAENTASKQSGVATSPGNASTNSESRQNGSSSAGADAKTDTDSTVSHPQSTSNRYSGRGGGGDGSQRGGLYNNRNHHGHYNNNHGHHGHINHNNHHHYGHHNHHHHNHHHNNNHHGNHHGHYNHHHGHHGHHRDRATHVRMSTGSHNGDGMRSGPKGASPSMSIDSNGHSVGRGPSGRKAKKGGRGGATRHSHDRHDARNRDNKSESGANQDGLRQIPEQRRSIDAANLSNPAKAEPALDFGNFPPLSASDSPGPKSPSKPIARAGEQTETSTSAEVVKGSSTVIETAGTTAPDAGNTKVIESNSKVEESKGVSKSPDAKKQTKIAACKKTQEKQPEPSTKGKEGGEGGTQGDSTSITNGRGSGSMSYAAILRSKKPSIPATTQAAPPKGADAVAESAGQGQAVGDDKTGTSAASGGDATTEVGRTVTKAGAQPSNGSEVGGIGGKSNGAGESEAGTNGNAAGSGAGYGKERYARRRKSTNMTTSSGGGNISGGTGAGNGEVKLDGDVDGSGSRNSGKAVSDSRSNSVWANKPKSLFQPGNGVGQSNMTGGRDVRKTSTAVPPTGSAGGREGSEGVVATVPTGVVSTATSPTAIATGMAPPNRGTGTTKPKQRVKPQGKKEEAVHRAAWNGRRWSSKDTSVPPAGESDRDAVAVGSAS